MAIKSTWGHSLCLLLFTLTNSRTKCSNYQPCWLKHHIIIIIITLLCPFYGYVWTLMKLKRSQLRLLKKGSRWQKSCLKHYWRTTCLRYYDVKSSSRWGFGECPAVRWDQKRTLWYKSHCWVTVGGWGDRVYIYKLLPAARSPHASHRPACLRFTIPGES